MPIATATKRNWEDAPGRSRPWRFALGLLALFIGCLRFLYLRADFPNFSQWAVDQAKYTDEGWWASAAVRHRLFGYWNLPGDYNPAVAVPVWPFSLDLLFRVTGVSLVAARALSVTTSVATLGIVFVLVRRYAKAESEWASTLAVILLATSPFAFVYSRLAILDTCVIFQFSLLLLIASCAGDRLAPVLLSMAILIPAIVLTKTTAIVLLPAVVWIAWTAMKGRALWVRVAALAAVGIVATLLVRASVAFIFVRGHELEYRKFYEDNSLTPIDWSQTAVMLADMIKDCMWSGRVLFPLAVLVVALAILWLRALWRNPLFVACCLAIGGQMAFLFAAQGSYAPRYFLPMLVPLSVLVALAMEEIRCRVAAPIYLGTLIPVGAALGIGMATVSSFLMHRTSQFYDAAMSIQRIVEADPRSNRLMLGVSGADLSLITRLPSISDVYGTYSLPEKLAAYQPGWYLAWNRVGAGEREALRGYRLVEVARYPAFDDDERNQLILYRLESLSR